MSSVISALRGRPGKDGAAARAALSGGGGTVPIAEIQARTGMEEELRLSDLMEYPTLGAFTAHLESLQATEESGSI